MFFSPSASIAEIAAASPAALRTLEQLGIDCRVDGSRPVADVCRDKGLDASDVIADIAWTAAPLAELIRHIVAIHHEFLRREFPLISQRLARVAEVYAEREPQIMSELPGVFQGLVDDLSLHMRKEEMMLFPTIEAYEAAAATRQSLPPTPFGSVANPIRMMESEHDNAEGALARLRELTNGYTVPRYGCVTYAAMMEGLRAVEADLHRHIHLENDILFPRAMRLEQENTSGSSAFAAS
jgi:regulator of cell morphogenesis and NO signaling